MKVTPAIICDMNLSLFQPIFAVHNNCQGIGNHFIHLRENIHAFFISNAFFELSLKCCLGVPQYI